MQRDSALQRVTAKKNSKRVAAGRKGAETRKKLRALKATTIDSRLDGTRLPLSEPASLKTMSSSLHKDIWENPKVLLALGTGAVFAVAYFLYSKSKSAPVVPVSRSDQTPNLEVLLNTSNDNDIFTL